MSPVAHRAEACFANRTQYTARLRVSRRQDSGLKLKRSSVPLQIMLCVRDQVSTFEAQQWIVAAFGSVLEPRVWVPVKVGDAPPPETFYDAWAAEVQVDRGRNYYGYGEQGNTDASSGEAAEAPWPDSGPVDFVVEDRPADERYREYLAILDEWMRSQRSPASNLSGGNQTSRGGRARDFFRNLTHF